MADKYANTGGQQGSQGGQSTGRGSDSRDDQGGSMGRQDDDTK